MVEVRFACIPSVEGVKCTLDGVVKYSDSGGFASFFDISQGEHTYAIEAPAGWKFVSGADVFGRPLYKSGTTIIEWYPVPGVPWPEDQPWMMLPTFAEGAEIPFSPVAAVMSAAMGVFTIAMCVAPSDWMKPS